MIGSATELRAVARALDQRAAARPERDDHAARRAALDDLPGLRPGAGRRPVGSDAHRADELAALSCDDPLALDALGRGRLARLHLEQLWLPLLERILTDRPARAGRPGWPSTTSVESLLRIVSTLPGWPLGTDRCRRTRGVPSSPPTAAQVGRAGRRPRTRRPHRADRHAGERQWLAAELALIAADPALAATFAAGFDRWGELGRPARLPAQAALDDSIRPVGEAARLDVAHIDATYAAMALIWTSVHGRMPSST